MKDFTGFPAKARFTPLPNIFFSAIIPEIDDISELKSTLYIFWLLYPKRGYLKHVTYRELREAAKGLSDEALRHGLELSVKRGTIISLTIEGDEKTEDVYFLNTEADRRAIAKIKSGELSIGRLPKGEPQAPLEQPSVFILYEQNIGMLTPMIAEELKEAEKLYPASWIEDAFKEAVSLNKRSWRYISRILERWAAEGKDHGKPGPDSKEDKYIKGKYGHLIRR